MKTYKLFTIVVALVCAAQVFAADFEKDGIYYNYLGGDSVKVTYGPISHEYSGFVTIPATVSHNGTTYRVTAIGNNALSFCSSLTSITIPNSVTIIDDMAFYECSKLTSITIPNGVTTIGRSVFNDCTILKNITISKSVTTIGHNAFVLCPSVETIIVESGNPTYHSVGNCIIETATKTLHTGCKNSIIPTDGSVTNIANAFDGCHNLTKITIPNSVTNLGVFAFASCLDLTEITCQAVTPPSIPPSIDGDLTFHRVDKTIPLYVPAESVEAYKAAYGWKDFTNIQGY